MRKNLTSVLREARINGDEEGIEVLRAGIATLTLALVEAREAGLSHMTVSH